jgi:O-acetyl-ADP-ribose deacetylase (regulator of RNase III)
MLTYIKGDLFNSPAQVLVNTVNIVGVMGKGIALEFKNRYPEMFKIYQDECDRKNLI